jgi:hypothetical protein
MQDTTNGRASVLPPMATRPVLDLLQILARNHNLDSLRDNASLDPWLLPCGANLLWLLTDSLIFGKMDLAIGFKPMVAALKSFHAAVQKDIITNHAHVYSEFESLESTLRRQSAAVDRRLGQSAKSQTTPKGFVHAVQQTLFVQCANRGKTAARFRVVNRTGKSSVVDFRPRFVAEACMPEAALIFEPNGLH